VTERPVSFKVMSDVQKWPATLEACDLLASDPSLSDADRALVAQMRQALTQGGSGKRPGSRPLPGDMEGVLSELERLRIEVEELRSDRDHWMWRWRQAANEILRLTPQSTIVRTEPPSDPNTFTLDEYWSQFNEEAWRRLVMPGEEMDAAKGTRGTEEDPIKEGIREYMRRKHAPFPANSEEAEAIQAYNSRVEAQGTFAAPQRSVTFAFGVLEELSRAAKHCLKDPSQSNRDWLEGALSDAQVVLTSSIVDVPTVNIDPPSMDDIDAEVKAVRRARAKRKGTP